MDLHPIFFKVAPRARDSCFVVCVLGVCVMCMYVCRYSVSEIENDSALSLLGGHACNY